MEIQIDMNVLEYCPQCLGTGELKVMQVAFLPMGGSVRGEDTKTKCSKCDGTGFVYK